MYECDDWVICDKLHLLLLLLFGQSEWFKESKKKYIVLVAGGEGESKGGV